MKKDTYFDEFIKIIDEYCKDKKSQKKVKLNHIILCGGRNTLRHGKEVSKYNGKKSNHKSDKRTTPKD